MLDAFRVENILPWWTAGKYLEINQEIMIVLGCRFFFFFPPPKLSPF